MPFVRRRAGRPSWRRFGGTPFVPTPSAGRRAQRRSSEERSSPDPRAAPARGRARGGLRAPDLDRSEHGGTSRPPGMRGGCGPLPGPPGPCPAHGRGRGEVPGGGPRRPTRLGGFARTQCSQASKRARRSASCSGVSVGVSSATGFQFATSNTSSSVSPSRTKRSPWTSRIWPATFGFLGMVISSASNRVFRASGPVLDTVAPIFLVPPGPRGRRLRARPRFRPGRHAPAG